ncbi:hypothetical protein [Nannocystis pusilla]|uniref:hypothetical protein n=1 Tax=Nannocystis pusilla TaxID=889268 RepID=UPI003DA3C1C6
MNFGDPWPQFQDEMPWEEDVDQMVMDGMPQPLVDNTPLIDQLLAEWNQQHPPPPPSGTTGGPTTSDTDGPTTGPDTSGGSSSTGTTFYSTESDSSPNIVGGAEGSSCACDGRGTAPTVPSLLALLGLLAVRPRRRR